MSLSYADARAMAVKMLSQVQIQQMHEAEEASGIWMMPYQIAEHFNLGSIKNWYGIPESNTQAQEVHSARIRAEVTRIARENHLSLDLSNTETRNSFDWFVHRCPVDFSFQKGGSLAKAIAASGDDF